MSFNTNFGLKMIRSQFLSQVNAINNRALSNAGGVVTVSKPVVGNCFINKQFVRNYQQTKNNKTILMSTKPHSDYAIMSVNSLKNECRKRGIKVSGRKSELINRLINNDSSLSSSAASQGYHTVSIANKTVNDKTKALQEMVKANKKEVKRKLEENKIKSINGVRSFSSTSDKKIQATASEKAKGDSSHIDYFKTPDLLNQPKDIETPIRIISLQTSKSKEQEEFQGKKIAQKANPKETTSAKILAADDSKPITSESPIHKQTIVSAPFDSTSSTTLSYSDTITSSASGSSLAEDLDLPELPQSFHSFIQKITSNPLAYTEKKVSDSLSESGNSSGGGSKYQYEDVKFSYQEKAVFLGFAASVFVYWTGFNYFEKEKK